MRERLAGTPAAGPSAVVVLAGASTPDLAEASEDVDLSLAADAKLSVPET